MREPTFLTLDGNEAVARVAFKLYEVIAIYPITPSAAMGEWAGRCGSMVAILLSPGSC